MAFLGVAREPEPLESGPLELRRGRPRCSGGVSHQCPAKEKRIRNFSLTSCFVWWRTRDSNPGPKDYDSPKGGVCRG